MRGFSCRTLFQAACLVLVAAASSTAAPADWPGVEMQDATTAGAVRRARRLANARCQRVLSDFQDQKGRPLQEKLAELGVTGASYLARIRFTEGWGTGECEGNDRLAFTIPGGKTVWVCGGKFEHAYAANSRWAEATLIHEALHTLGLGEGPPSSLAITGRVLERCGR